MWKGRGIKEYKNFLNHNLSLSWGSQYSMENIANDSVTSLLLTDSNYSSWGEDIIRYVTGDPLCCVFDTNAGLHIKYTSILKNVTERN